MLFLLNLATIISMDSNNPKKKEPGHYVGMGVALGVGIGSALGVALDNLAIGVALGTSIGVAIGAGLEEDAKKRGEIRELTKEEATKCRRRNRLTLIFGIGLAAITIGVVMYFILLNR